MSIGLGGFATTKVQALVRMEHQEVLGIHTHTHTHTHTQTRACVLGEGKAAPIFGGVAAQLAEVEKRLDNPGRGGEGDWGEG